MTVPNGISPLKLGGLTGSQKYEVWKTFRFQFDNFLMATKHDADEEPRKVALLLHMLGVELVPIFQSFNKDVSKLKYKELVDLFENYFAPKKNIALERNTFLSRRQKGDESLESFLTDLKNLASTCELGTLKDSLVRDLFILGLLEENTHIKERLLQEGGDKSIDDIMDLARTIEMSRSEGKSHMVMKIDNKSFKSSVPQYSSYKKNQQTSQQHSYSCSKCGYQHNRNAKCPAQHAVCNKCQRKGQSM